jgi:uncharacterized protein
MKRAAAAALVALAAVARAEAPIPPLTGPVVDAAGLLSSGDERRLEELARSARARDDGQGVQLQYLLVRSLEGEPIEEYSIRVAEKWKVGTKGKDNGLLVTVAVEDRAWRIEVGGGLEGEIPDALARRVGDQILVPAFRQGRFAEGLYDAGAQLLTLAGVAPEDVQAHARSQQRGVTRLPSGFGAIVALMVILWIVSNVFRGFGPRRRRHMGWGGGPWIGGGGFSGGGASGRW